MDILLQDHTIFSLIIISFLILTLTEQVVLVEISILTFMYISMNFSIIMNYVEFYVRTVDL
jgi:hypothetical protein